MNYKFLSLHLRHPVANRNTLHIHKLYNIPKDDKNIDFLYRLTCLWCLIPLLIKNSKYLFHPTGTDRTLRYVRNLDPLLSSIVFYRKCT